ncbi:hypothetical protein [Peribacillus sp. NPDC060253]|uniref:hypothetical protein n=1 Tax=Peribacillus sp. NPDC060253 TaxID=3347084 RepID=UPI0036576C82
MTDLTMIEAFWRILPAALLVPFITFYLGRLGSYKDRKLKYRTFLDVDELVAKYRLENLPNLKNGTKLIIPKEHKSLEEEINDQIKQRKYDSNNTLNYLKISPLGESIITSGWLKVEMRSTKEKEKWYLVCSLPIIKKDEEVYIPTDQIDKLNYEYYISEIKVKYQTQAGEKLLFKRSSRKNKKNETVVKDSHGVKKWNLFYYGIQNTNGSNAEWIFLNRDKESDKE